MAKLRTAAIKLQNNDGKAGRKIRPLAQAIQDARKDND